MSRRVQDPAAQRAAQNQATIKSLLKLEPNKICADCKRNKHPRWASWNLGVFVCIRCSGIHRGMGTHISRVKSVDLDSWTDEQLQSILSWGNARANKYWEAKLAAGHVPSESKIENFIRTKYELKRWAMDGPRPDPSTLDVDGDDDVPLSIVKEKQTIDRNETIRKTSIGQQSAPRAPIAAPQPDLIGGVDAAPPRASTAGPPPSGQPPPKAQPAPPKSTSTKESLLGLDFLGGTTAPPRPASTTGVSTPGAQSRPDLKQSILSLYASAPRQPPPQQQQQQQQNVQHQQQGSFGGFGSPTMSHHQQQPSGGGFTDAFSSLSLASTTSPKPAAADPFASLGSPNSSTRQAPASNNSFGGLSGGGFFSPKPAQPAQPAQPTHQKQPSSGGFGGFGDFGDFTSPAPAASTQPKPAQPSSSAMGDLFDLSAPATTSQPMKSPPATMSPQASSNSVFNLSAPQTTSPPQPKPATAAPSAFGGGGFSSGADVWGSNEWSTPDPTPAPAAAPTPALRSPPAPAAPSNDFGGWGGSGGFGAPAPAPAPAGPPKVSADEEFGGWTSSTAQQSSTTNKSAGGSFGGNDEDLFSNVWQ